MGPTSLIDPIRWFVFGVAVAVLAGCGSHARVKTMPVQGKVVFEKGGSVKKLADAEAAVVFESVDPPGFRGTAAVEEDGRLGNLICTSAKQEQPAAGLAEGTYRVKLELAEQHRGLVDSRFLSFEKSGITVKVPPPEGEIVITVWR
jgi:hypothetical protein